MANLFRWKSSKRRSAAQKAQVQRLNALNQSRKRNPPPSPEPTATLTGSPPENDLPGDTLAGDAEEAKETLEKDTRRRNSSRWNPGKRRSAAQKAQMQRLNALRQSGKRDSLPSTTPEPAQLPLPPENNLPHDTLRGETMEFQTTLGNETREPEARGLSIALGDEGNNVPDKLTVS